MVRQDNRARPAMSKPPAPPATFFGFHAVRLGQIDSTSDEAARRLRAATLFLPAVIVADVQTRGRGTRGRTWHSTDARGSLTATFALIMYPSRPVQHLPLLAGLAVRDALADVAGPAADGRLTIKWPNDVMLDGRKLTGLLCERRDGADLIGVGVNLLPPVPQANGEAASAAGSPAEQIDFAPRTAYLGEAAQVSRDVVLEAIARRIATDLLPPHVTLAERINDLRRHDFLGGRSIELDTPSGPVTGRCEGIAADGRLVVGEGEARRIVASGTVVRYWEDG